jgi:hypothetical protein
MPAAVGRHLMEHYHYELPCMMCGELFPVPFGSRHLYGYRGELYEASRGKLRPWLCDPCADEAVLKRAEKRAKHDGAPGGEAGGEAVMSGTPAQVG